MNSVIAITDVTRHWDDLGNRIKATLYTVAVPVSFCDRKGESERAIVSIAPADRKSPVSRYILANETFTIVTTANAIPFVRRAVANFFTALCM